MENRELIAKLLKPYNIAYSEYACPHCGGVPPNMVVLTDEGTEVLSIEYDLLFGIFSQIRSELGKPIMITSGYRCVDHERRMFYSAQMGIATTITGEMARRLQRTPFRFLMLPPMTPAPQNTASALNFPAPLHNIFVVMEPGRPQVVAVGAVAGHCFIQAKLTEQLIAIRHMN